MRRKHILLSVAFMTLAWEKVGNDGTLTSKKAFELMQQYSLTPFSWAEKYYDMPPFKKIMQTFGYKKEDIERWFNATNAETMAETLDYLSPCTKYPEFVLLMLLKRKCRSRHEAILAIREYERQSPQADIHWQIHLAKAALKCACDNVLEMTVPVCRIYVQNFQRYQKEGKMIARPFEENALVHKLAMFSTHELHSASDAKVLLQAQQILCQGLKLELNSISVFSISWLLLSTSPTDALRTARLKGEIGDIKPFQRHLATFGPAYIEMLLTSSFAEAYRVFVENSLGSSLLPPRVLERNWCMFILALKRQNQYGLLLANSVVDLMQAQNFKYSQYLVTSLLQLCSTRVDRRQLLHRIEPYVELDAEIKLGLGYVSSSEEFDEMFNEASRFGQNLSYQSLQSLLGASVKHGNHHSFKIYQQILKDRHQSIPTSWMLQKLCQAAYKPFIRWGDYFAPQEATHECFKYLRGLDPQSDPSDVTKVYPTPQTVYAYTVMLGKAQYLDKMREVLVWLERIKMPPQRKTLMALIYYLPEGQRLFDLGTRAGPEWPTKEEYEMYILENHLEPKEY